MHQSTLWIVSSGDVDTAFDDKDFHKPVVNFGTLIFALNNSRTLTVRSIDQERQNIASLYISLGEQTHNLLRNISNLMTLFFTWQQMQKYLGYVIYLEERYSRPPVSLFHFSMNQFQTKDLDVNRRSWEMLKISYWNLLRSWTHLTDRGPENCFRSMWGFIWRSCAGEVNGLKRTELKLWMKNLKGLRT